jgi:putative endonuclease
MQGWVYMLRSRTGRHYYGSTNDLIRRLEQHGRGHTATTAKDRPWELVASHEFADVAEAREWERTFKRWKKPERALMQFERWAGDAQG